jgi:hypothetical protein
MAIITPVSEIRWDWSSENLPSYPQLDSYYFMTYRSPFAIDESQQQLILPKGLYNAQEPNFWRVSKDWEEFTPDFSIPDNWSTFDWENQRLIYLYEDENEYDAAKIRSYDIGASDPWVDLPFTADYSLRYRFYLSGSIQTTLYWTPNFILGQSGNYEFFFYPLASVPSFGSGFFQIADFAQFHSEMGGSYQYSGSSYSILGYNHHDRAFYIRITNVSSPSYSKLVKLSIDTVLVYNRPSGSDYQVHPNCLEILGDFTNESGLLKGFALGDRPGIFAWKSTSVTSGVSLNLYQLNLTTPSWQPVGITCPFVPETSPRYQAGAFDHWYFTFDNASDFESWRVHIDTGEWESYFPVPMFAGSTGRFYLKAPGDPAIYAFGGRTVHRDAVHRWDLIEETWNFPSGYWRFLNILYPHRDGTPLGRSDTTFAYNDFTQKFLMFSGQSIKNSDGSGGRVLFDDLWELEPLTFTWEQKSYSGVEVPSGRINHSFHFNKMNGCYYLYGGVFSLDYGAYSPFDDVWKLDTNFTWSQVTQRGTRPTARYNHGSIFRPIDNSLYIIGGRGPNNSILKDFWKLDLTTGAWTLLSNSLPELVTSSFLPPIQCAYDEDRDIMYVLSSSSDLRLLTFYFVVGLWNTSEYSLPSQVQNKSSIIYDNIDDQLYIFSDYGPSTRGSVSLIRRTTLETEPVITPNPEFPIPVKKVCEPDRTDMVPMDDCSWWWESVDKSLFLPLEERAAKIGSVRVRYSKYKQVKDHPLAFFTQVLEGSPNLYIEHEGVSCRFSIPENFLVDPDFSDGDFDNIVLVPDSDRYEPIVLDSERNDEVLLDQFGYKSEEYNVYITSFNPLWETLKEGYTGAVVLSQNDPNTGSLLRCRIDGTVVFAKKVGRVKLKISMSKDKFVSDPYLGESLELVPGSGEMKKIKLFGSDANAYIGLLNCCFYWQSHYTSGSPIYLAINYVVDDEVLGYDYSVVLRSCILPENVDLDGMVRSGRLDAPPLPDRYFHVTMGSSEAPVSYGTKLLSEAKWYQISSDNGMIGGVMPSVGDAILVEILMQPSSTVQKEHSTLYKAPVVISSASLRVKYTSDVGYIKTQRSNLEEVPRIPDDYNLPCVTSIPIGPGVQFFLDLTDFSAYQTATTDLVQGRFCSFSGSTKLAGLHNPGGSNYSVRFGNANTYSFDNDLWSGHLEVVDEVEVGSEYIYPEDQFILSCNLYLDVDNADSSGKNITCVVDLLRVGLEQQQSNLEDFPVDSIFFHPSWGYSENFEIVSSSYYLCFALAVLRNRYFSLYWRCDHLYLMPDSQVFQLDPTALPYNQWFKLSVTRNRETNEYAWFLDDAVIKDENGRDCRWTSKTFWYSSPTTEIYRGPASNQVPFSPLILSCQGVKDSYIYACHYKLDKFNSLI